MSSTNAIRQNAFIMSFLGQCMDDYLEWYCRVSYHVDGPSSVGGHSDDITPPHSQTSMIDW